MLNGDFEIIARTGSPDQTKRLAEALALALRAGDVVLLSGDLGAGKTQFAQGIAAGLAAYEPVISPTFNIVLTYASGRLPLHHFDLYRLERPSQLEDIGLREYVESGGVCVVEWAEKFPDAFDEYLRVSIAKVSEGEREVRACAVGARYGELLDAWRASIDSPGIARAVGEGGSPTAARRINALSPANGLPACASGDTPLTDRGSLRREELRAGPPFSAGGGDTPLTGKGSLRRAELRAEAPLPAMSGFDRAEVRDESALQGNLRLPTEDVAALRLEEAELGLARGEGASAEGSDGAERDYVLAFDTANEVVAVGVGELLPEERGIRVVATREVRAHRASNTTLLPTVDALLGELGIGRASIACVCVGRGPGSFTGVRIAMATAKGIAQALGVSLVGVSTLDAVAWGAYSQGVRGNLLVVADAMRKEVYPARFALFDDGVMRQTADCVVKADALADELANEGERVGECAAGSAADLLIVGDGLVKYREIYESYGQILDERLWDVTGRGLLCAFGQAWKMGEIDPFDGLRHDPGLLLPVYTRLSDAEENERIRLANNDPKNLETGVQDVAPDGGKGRVTMHSQADLAARVDDAGVSYRPLDAAHAADVAALEDEAMGTDAWNADLVAGELGQRNRTWWVAEARGALVGYAGGLVVDGDLQILKVAVNPMWRRRGVARELVRRLAEDARNLGASTCSLEVRAGNTGAQAFYESLGLAGVGTRPRYYSDREDALIMRGSLPIASRDVAGMKLKRHDETVAKDAIGKHPLILAIESSCDETAAAVVDGQGSLLSDVVASQIDFHARFGGVVPEIASRKHIEAICGVCSEALAVADGASWRDIDAVAVTYAPGLLGALVVGVAFAKGAAWALDVPFIGVNHLEGHLYANKIGEAGFAPPAVVSLVSGGNTMLVSMRDWGDYETLGSTIDDAVGEAFDKVAKALGLGYPGGPVISREAAKGDSAAIDFPRAMLHSHDLRFSLSGLKTAVVNYINGERQAGRELNVSDIAASFQQAVIDVQVAKAKTALQQTGAPTFCLGGGVAANPALRAAYEELCARLGVRLVMPPLSSCGDNAGMIALVALDRYNQRAFFPLSADAQAHADLDEPY